MRIGLLKSKIDQVQVNGRNLPAYSWRRAVGRDHMGVILAAKPFRKGLSPESRG